MFVRALLSFHAAPLPGHNQNLLSSIIPTLARLSRKSNHSRTYRTPPGGGGLVIPIQETNCSPRHHTECLFLYLIYFLSFLYFLYLPFPRTNFPTPRINIHQQHVLYSPPRGDSQMISMTPDQAAFLLQYQLPSIKNEYRTTSAIIAAIPASNA